MFKITLGSGDILKAIQAEQVLLPDNQVISDDRNTVSLRIICESKEHELDYYMNIFNKANALKNVSVKDYDTNVDVIKPVNYRKLGQLIISFKPDGTKLANIVLIR